MRHEFAREAGTRSVNVDGRDMDQIAFDELGTELESLRLTELNAVVLIEHDYDMTRIQTVMVPTA